MVDILTVDDRFPTSRRAMNLLGKFSGRRDESQSWKEGAYLGAAISLSPVYVIRGTDAERFFSEHLVNDFAHMEVGTFRHGIMCNQWGQIMKDGVVLRTAEQEFYTFWLLPYIEYAFQLSSYDATGENLTGQHFLFQVAGPRSLEILEHAAGADLHDISFGHHRPATIAGAQVRIFRLGTAGSLAYEVHGDTPDGQAVYAAVRGGGRDYGLQKPGHVAYTRHALRHGLGEPHQLGPRLRR